MSICPSLLISGAQMWDCTNKIERQAMWHSVTLWGTADIDRVCGDTGASEGSSVTESYGRIIWYSCSGKNEKKNTNSNLLIMLARRLLKEWSLGVRKSHHFVDKAFRSWFIRLILWGTKSSNFYLVHPWFFSSNVKIFVHLRSCFMSFPQGLICQHPSSDMSVYS